MNAPSIPLLALPWRQRLPGMLLVLTVALAASALAGWLGGPVVLHALLIGLALNFLGDHPVSRPGLDASARDLLRVGVALLGMRITLGQALLLGWSTVLLMALAVVGTVGLGAWLARRLGRPLHEGLISGAACGICGASAALAVASVMPRGEDTDRYALVVVIGVTVMSTVAMVLYPLALHGLDVGVLRGGVFLGGTVHDVAQVVAAASMWEGPGADQLLETATLAKLIRVAMLFPVVLVLAWVVRGAAGRRAAAPLAEGTPVLPGFLLAFVGFMLLASAGGLSPAVVDAGQQLSRLLLAMAVAAVGMKTRLQDLRRVGWVPLLMLLAETLWVAALVGTGLWLA
jgi:uncharacterized integral membrane protein (TIGR00698 family)